MKIAFCTFVSLSHYGGSEIWIAEMARLLTERGHRVEVYATPYSHGGRKVEPESFMPDIPYHESWRSKIEADVAYIYYYSPLVWRALFLVKCPKIAGLHPPGLLSKRSPRHHLFRLIGSQDLTSFDAVRTLSPIFRFKHNNIFQIPEWVDTKSFSPGQTLPDKFTILFVGRQRREKGWETLIQVVSKLSQNHDFDFIATGEGNEAVCGLGSVSHQDMPEIYRKAHIMVYPSLADVFSLTILEALSCGLPVITTPTPAHRSMELPLLYAQSVDEFARQVSIAYEGWRSNTGSYQELSRSCRESVLKYDFNKVFSRLERMFESVANRGRTTN